MSIEHPNPAVAITQQLGRVDTIEQLVDALNTPVFRMLIATAGIGPMDFSEVAYKAFSDAMNLALARISEAEIPFSLRLQCEDDQVVIAMSCLPDNGPRWYYGQQQGLDPEQTINFLPFGNAVTNFSSIVCQQLAKGTESQFSFTYGNGEC